MNNSKQSVRSTVSQSSGAKACPATAGSGFAMKVLASSLVLAFGAPAYALPVGGVLAAGNATIANGANNTTITQTTANAVINWQGFNIGAGQSVVFVQPSVASVTLNRVLDANPSSILGTMSANGRVFLVNPNGILFGQGASVNVGGIVATTLNISDANFMAGKHVFSGDSNAQVLNQGSIVATGGGSVALLGAHVSNEGLVQANLGSVTLAAGKAMTLDLAGDGLLHVTVDQGAINALASNGGLLRADGGMVTMSARSAGSLLPGAVNNSGVIQAQAFESHNGSIRLVADAQAGMVNVGGTLDVSGQGAGQSGGTVEILGHAVSLVAASIDASGQAGGGTVLVGGNFHGAGPQSNSQSTSLDRATLINADALAAGNGGRIAIWSDGVTHTAASLTARGGAQSGDGGMIETSAPRVVLGEGSSINTLAPQGKTGLWLLDPTDWIIANVGGDETPATVAIRLATTDRVIDASNDITVSNDVTWSTPQRLTLDAGHDILLNATLTASAANSSIALIAGNDVKLAVGQAITASNSGSVILITAGNDVAAAGTITASGSNALVDITAGRDLSVTTVTASGGGSIKLRAAHDLSVATTTANGGGNIDLGAGNNVELNGAVTANGGVVTLRADNDGSGPGAAAGTVIFAGAGSVTAPTTVIRFNPATYASTATEIAAYTPKVFGAIDARAWVFAQGNNKVYDGNTVATLAFRGNPASGGDVNLQGGSASFDTKDVGNAKQITFNGYTLAGANASRFALYAPTNGTAGDGVTTGNITPAPLTIKANNGTKVFGTVATFAATAFTSTGLVNGETVGGVTETSPGTVATAPPGPAYPITPSNATGGSFSSSNYAINYVNGSLTVTPALDVVVLPGTTLPIASLPGSTPPGSTPPDATPPDLPTGTLPGATSPSTTSPGDSDTGTSRPFASVGRPDLLNVSNTGVALPNQQLARLSSPDPVPGTTTAPVVERDAVARQVAPAAAPLISPPAPVVPMRRAPKQDRN
ncbi:MAG: hxuA 1 [Paucimonas sp.]|nr:hxuA 1 [Paucimonas sp.]